jgi:hypothetical protein
MEIYMVTLTLRVEPAGRGQELEYSRTFIPLVLCTRAPHNQEESVNLFLGCNGSVSAIHHCGGAQAIKY